MADITRQNDDNPFTPEGSDLGQLFFTDEELKAFLFTDSPVFEEMLLEEKLHQAEYDAAYFDPEEAEKLGAHEDAALLRHSIEQNDCKSLAS